MIGSPNWYFILDPPNSSPLPVCLVIKCNGVLAVLKPYPELRVSLQGVHVMDYLYDLENYPHPALQAYYYVKNPFSEIALDVTFQVSVRGSELSRATSLM